MPVGMVLHKGNTLSLKCLGEEHRWLPFGASSSIECLKQSNKIVPIDDQRVPAKSRPPGAIGFHVVLEHGGIALPEPIYINNGAEVIQPMMTCNLSRFPIGSLDRLSVAHQDVNPVIQLIDEFCVQGDPDSDWKALSQRTGGHIDKRQARGRMAFKVRGQSPEL